MCGTLAKYKEKLEVHKFCGGLQLFLYFEAIVFSHVSSFCLSDRVPSREFFSDLNCYDSHIKCLYKSLLLSEHFKM